MPTPTWSLTVVRDGVTVLSVTGLNAQPTTTAGPPPRVEYTLNNGDAHTYWIKAGDDVCIKQS